MWFPPLLDANTTIHAWQDKALTISANEPPIFFWQSGSGSHGNLPCDFNISLRQLRIFVNNLYCETEESTDALQSHMLGSLHFSKDYPHGFH